MLIKREKPISEKYQKVLSIVLFSCVPIILFFITELLNVNGLSVFQYPVTILVNLVFFYLIEVSLFFFTKRGDIAIIVTTVLFGVLAIANGYIVEFRGYGFSISDIHSVETAVNIMEEYTYLLNEMQLLSLVLMFFVIKFSTKLCLQIEKNIVGSILTPGLLLLYIVVLTQTPILESIGIVPKFYYDHPNGVYVNLFGTIEVLNRDKTPDDYSAEKVLEYYDELNQDYNDKYVPSEKTVPTNIICIMNEALADLTIYEGFDLGYDPLQNIHSLKENTISGFTYSSVYGGNTVISEYEFLTNNTAYFFGSTMSPYSTFVDDNSFSLAKQLNAYGYNSVFVHPYKKISYNRPYAYNCMGFNEQYYDMDLIEKYAYEHYYSDFELYKIIENMTENQEKTFVFAVTVQNHSPYTLMDDVDIEQIDSKYDDLTDKYLSVLQESDKAFMELIEYYSNCDEPTIIVMFGDHQPKLNNEFFDTVANVPLNKLLSDSEQKLYKTPFVIWANYPISEQSNAEVSINYLSTLMLEQTGISKTPYQYYLSNLMKEVPIVTNNGFIDKFGNQYRSIQDLPQSLQVLLQKYEYFEYNLIFDKKNVINALSEIKK